MFALAHVSPATVHPRARARRGDGSRRVVARCVPRASARITTSDAWRLRPRRCGMVRLRDACACGRARRLPPRPRCVQPLRDRRRARGRRSRWRGRQVRRRRIRRRWRLRPRAPPSPRHPDTRGTGESDDSSEAIPYRPLRSSPSSPPSRVRPTATRLTPGGCGSSSRSRASASPQRLRQRPHDGDQAQVRRPLDPRPRRPHRRVHRSPPRARRPRRAHRPPHHPLRAQDLRRSLSAPFSRRLRLDRARSVVLAREPSPPVLRHLQDGHAGRGYGAVGGRVRDGTPPTPRAGRRELRLLHRVRVFAQAHQDVAGDRRGGVREREHPGRHPRSRSGRERRRRKLHHRRAQVSESLRHRHQSRVRTRTSAT